MERVTGIEFFEVVFLRLSKYVKVAPLLDFSSGKYAQVGTSLAGFVTIL